MKVFIALIPWVKPWHHIHFACIVSLNKLSDDKARHMDRYIHK